MRNKLGSPVFFRQVQPCLNRKHFDMSHEVRPGVTGWAQITESKS